MDLRVEVQHREDADELVAGVKDDYRNCGLDAVDRGILDFANKLTCTPSEMGPDDIAGLRALGLDDPTIHDVVQVTGLFNYYDRLADGLGIEPEPEFPPRPVDC